MKRWVDIHYKRIFFISKMQNPVDGGLQKLTELTLGQAIFMDDTLQMSSADMLV